MDKLRARVLPVVCWLVLLAVNGTFAATAVVGASPDLGSTFYFHYVSQSYRNQNASITLIAEANLTPPLGTASQVVEVVSAIRNATSIFGSVWVGTVAWVTQPLTQSAAIQGPVVFAVWLSSDDFTSTFSGLGAGIAILNQQNQTVGNYVYTYSYAQGRILTSTPKEYDFTVDWNRQVESGQRLVFAVGVGSTSEGWRMKVNYGTEQYPSHAQLPSPMQVVQEFTQPLLLLGMICVTVVALSVIQRVPEAIQRPLDQFGIAFGLGLGV